MHITNKISFISNANKAPIYNIRNYKQFQLQMQLPGIELGIPLNIFQNVYTNLHYGFDITDVKTIGLQFALGYFSYGSDRLSDALSISCLSDEFISPNKLKLYNYIQNNRPFIVLTLLLSYTYAIVVLSENITTLPFIALLWSTIYYKSLKINFGQLKAAYISFLWVSCTVILPCVIYEDNYSILHDPQTYMSAFFCLYASSNIADIKDIIEDKYMGIKTLPVTLGAYRAYLFSCLAVLLSSLLFISNDNFNNRPIINSLFELQNLIPLFAPVILNISYTEDDIL